MWYTKCVINTKLSLELIYFQDTVSVPSLLGSILPELESFLQCLEIKLGLDLITNDGLILLSALLTKSDALPSVLQGFGLYIWIFNETIEYRGQAFSWVNFLDES